jgi:hypothetical protein
MTMISKIFIISISFIFNFVYSQQPPSMFGIKLDDIGKNYNNVNEQYKFYVKVIHNESDNNYSKSRLSNITLNHDGFEKTINYIYIYGLFGTENSIVVFTIYDSINKKYMNLYIKLYDSFNYGKIAYLSNFKFKKGNYFFDTTKKNEKYKIDNSFNHESSDEIYFNIKNLKKHKISSKKMRKLLENSNYE